ncbi:hypothetical protein HD554DRAFT_2136371 [Boletus coccyginus]|nr:hypothetical protein HD554DRAFT_2136371 [Boletus coccyginus]
MRQRRSFPSSLPLTTCFPSARTATEYMAPRPSITIGFASFRPTILDEELFLPDSCVLISTVLSTRPVLTIHLPEGHLGKHIPPRYQIDGMKDGGRLSCRRPKDQSIMFNAQIHDPTSTGTWRHRRNTLPIVPPTIPGQQHPSHTVSHTDTRY